MKLIGKLSHRNTGALVISFLHIGKLFSSQKEGNEKDGRLAAPLQDLNTVGYTEEPAYF